MTLIQHIEQAAQHLSQAKVALGQGTIDYYDEAAWLVLWAAGLSVETDISRKAFLKSPANLHPSAAVNAHINATIERRIQQRLPAAYITQEAWLQGLAFHSDPRATIPRSLIAEIIADGSADGWIHPKSRHALDLHTGAGSLAILAAITWPDLHLTARDDSPDALDLAQQNIQRHQLTDRITTQLGTDLSASPERYDLILCKPPYVNAKTVAKLPPEFLAEPQTAVAGGSDGMDPLRRLLPQLPNALQTDGILLLEIGHERRHFDAAFPDLAPIWLATSAGPDSVLLLSRDMLLEAQEYAGAWERVAKRGNEQCGSK